MRHFKQKIAMLLAVCMVFTGVMPSFADEGIEDAEELTEVTEVTEVTSEELSELIKDLSDEDNADDNSVYAIEEVTEASEADSEELSETLSSGSEALLGEGGSYGLLQYGNTVYNLNSLQDVENVLGKTHDIKALSYATVKLKLNTDWTTVNILKVKDDYDHSRSTSIDIDLNGHTWTITGTGRLETYSGVHIHNGTITFTNNPSAPFTLHGNRLNVNNVKFIDCHCGSEGLFKLVNYTYTRWEAPIWVSYYVKAELNLNNCLFDHCTAGKGSCVLLSDDGRVSAKNCTFKNCSSSGDGGVIHAYCDSTRLVDGVVLENCSFIHCESEKKGGAVYLYRAGEISFINCNAYYCNAEEGGFFYCRMNNDYSYDYRSDINGRGSVAYKCSAKNGGAVCTEKYSIRLKGFKFFNNKATEKGGAVYVKDSKGIDIKNNDFYGNTAGTGGAIYMNSKASRIENNVFYNDDATTQGTAEIMINQSQSEGDLSAHNDVWTNRDISELCKSDKPFTGLELHPIRAITLTGSGTDTAPYIISSLADLYQLAINTSEGIVESDEYYELRADIDNMDFTIGTRQHPFNAHFDGGLHTITLDQVSEDCGGLFGYTEGAEIKNLIIRGRVKAENHAGSVVGYAKAGHTRKTLIEDCRSYADIEALYESGVWACYGGIVGKLEASKDVTPEPGIINSCDYLGTITYIHSFSSLSFGGICGQLGEKCGVYNSINHGNILSGVHSTYDIKAGGIAGENAGHIINCANLGRLDVTKLGGGLCAVNSGQLKCSYNSGEIPDSGSYEAKRSNDAVCCDHSSGSSDIADCWYVEAEGYAGSTASDKYTAIALDSSVLASLNEAKTKTQAAYTGLTYGEWKLINSGTDLTIGDSAGTNRRVILHFNDVPVTGQVDRVYYVSAGTTIAEMNIEDILVSHRAKNWYSDKGLSKPWSISEPINENIELWSKGWERYSFTENNIEYELTGYGVKTVRVISAASYARDVPMVIPGTVEYEGISYEVVELGEKIIKTPNTTPKVVLDSTVMINVQSDSFTGYTKDISVPQSLLENYKQWFTEKGISEINHLKGHLKVCVNYDKGYVPPFTSEYYEYGTVIPTPVTPYDKEGYIFIGWRECNENWIEKPGAYYQPRALTEDLYLKAMWTEKEFMYDNLRFRVNKDAGTGKLSITLIPDGYKKYSGDIKIEYAIYRTGVYVPITGIAVDALKNCSEVTSITVGNDKPLYVEEGGLEGLDSLEKIIVPKASVDAYKNADEWKRYADKIVGKETTNISAVFAYNYPGAPLPDIVEFQWGHRIPEPKDPEREGYTFTGWYTEEECTNRYDFDVIPFFITILYAGWKEIPPILHNIPGDIEYYWSVNPKNKSASCEARADCVGDESHEHHQIRVLSQADYEVLIPASCESGSRVKFTAKFNIPTASESTAFTTRTWEATLSDALKHKYSSMDDKQHVCLREGCGKTENHIDTDKNGYCDKCRALMYHTVTVHFANGDIEDLRVRRSWYVDYIQSRTKGYTSSWHKDSVDGDVFEFHNFYYAVFEDFDLYEKLEAPIKYTLTWNAGEGTFSNGERIATTSAAYASTPTPYGTPSRAGYKFVSWYPDIAEVSGEATYTARYVEIEPEIYTVVFDTNGGGEIAAQTITEGGKVVEPATPTKSGYRFTGWYRNEKCTVRWDFDYDKVNSDITLYAGWEHDDLVITWDAGEGTFSNGEHEATNSAAYGSIPTPYGTPSNDGYEFAGWYPDIATVTEATTYHADYIEKRVQKAAVIFDTNGGSHISPVTVASGSTISEPTTPTKTGYTFAGWYKDEDCKSPWNFATDKAVGIIILYADWNAADCVITWDAVAGTFSNGERIATTSAAYGSIPTPYGTPSRAGYKFVSWYPDITEVKGATSYNARYVEEAPTVYTVVFDTNGGSEVPPQTVTQGSKAVRPEDPSKKGYNFVDWYRNEDCTTLWNFTSDTVTDDTTIYASWSQAKVSVSWSIKGDVKATEELNYGSIPQCPEAVINLATEAAAEGETFAGWHPAIAAVYEATVYEAQYESYEEPIYWSIDDDGVLYIASSRSAAGKENRQGCFDAVKLIDDQDGTWRTYKNEIVSVVSDAVKADRPERWFYDCASLSSANLKNLSLEDAGSLEQMFMSCENLVSVNLDGCDISAALELWQMFDGCTSLENVRFGDDANIFRAMDLWRMFADCSSLEAIDISEITSDSVECSEEMFINCSELKTIYVSEESAPSYAEAEETEKMFEGCFSLIGQQGTAYDDNKTDGEYAIIDQGEEARGYFTEKGSKPYEEWCLVYIDPCNGEEGSLQILKSGEHAVRPEEPKRSGYTFAGWYACGETEKYDFETREVTDSLLIIEAAWTENKPDPVNPSGRGGGSSKKLSMPQGAVNGLWTYHADTDKWTFAVGSYKYFDQWGYIYNPYAAAGQPQASWFYFDIYGNMATGWQWIRGTDRLARCYYLYPYSDGSGILGACQLGGVTPDGFTLDDSGAWILNGVVQTR